MKKAVYTIFALVAILFGLTAIIKIAGITEIIVGFLSLTFGITAIFWVLKARNSLSIGSELRAYSNLFLVSLLAIVAFSLADVLLFIFQNTPAVPFFYYLKYILITSAYLVFLSAAYKILSIGQTFGFNIDAKKIEKVMKERVKKKLVK